MPQALPYITVALAAYGANEQRRAGQAANKARRRDQRIADVNTLKSRREAIRERLVADARIRNLAANTGTADSSGAAGGVASLGSRTGSNIGLSNQIQELNQQRMSFLSEAASSETNAGLALSFSSAAGSMGGYEDIAKWFK